MYRIGQDEFELQNATIVGRLQEDDGLIDELMDLDEEELDEVFELLDNPEALDEVDTDEEEEGLGEGKLYWAMDVYGKKMKVASGAYLTPKFSFVMLAHPDNADIKLNQIVWESAKGYDTVVDDWIGSFYIYDGHDFDCRIELTRKSASVFHLKCKGKVDISSEYHDQEELIPFEIEVDLDYIGIACEDTDEDDSRTLLKEICNVDSYKWVQGKKFPILVPQE